MKHLIKLLVLVFVLAVLVAPGLAQDEVAPGEGGIIIQANTLGDPNFLNPLLANTTSERVVNRLMFPNIYSLDPVTRLPAPAVRNDQNNGLALDWTISDDGLVYTFTLRDDVFWSDGTPVTANDYKFTFDALASGEAASPRTNVLETITSVEAPDATTLVITLSNPSCRGIDEMDDFGILPEHAVRDQIGDDFAAINEMDFNKGPTATSGTFNFGALLPGTQVSLLNNPNHTTPVLPEGFIFKNIPDSTIAVEQLVADEINVIGQFDTAPENFDQLRDLDAAGELQTFEFPDSGYWWVALNQADPTNPQDGTDADGNIIDQGGHPMFGDVRVRRALAMSLDIDEIIDGALGGNGSPQLTHASPIAWALNTAIEPYPFDPEGALALLAEAGWVDDDGDPSTPLVATEDALFAEPGTEFSFVINHQTGDVSVDAAAAIMQNQWSQIGIEVELDALEFGALVGVLLGQEFDAIWLNWTNLPNDTDARSQFNPEFDIVGSGFNFVSYQNADLAQMYEDARLVPGCDPDERIPIYHDAQQLLHDELPYLFIYTKTQLVAIDANIQGFDPLVDNVYWNIGDWAVAEDLGG